MRVAAYLLIGFGGGNLFALLFVTGARITPTQRGPGTPTHVRLAPRAYDWSRDDAA